jgi:hypothetical protein
MRRNPAPSSPWRLARTASASSRLRYPPGSARHSEDWRHLSGTACGGAGAGFGIHVMGVSGVRDLGFTIEGYESGIYLQTRRRPGST